MLLLGSSTAAHRNKVKILFYGQSISEQDWWHQVEADLRRRFPHADLEVRNRAIGGFPSQQLVKPAEHDIFSFYPDLVIFHVYGADQPYEAIIRSIRSRTTAEVLIQTDHVTRWPPAVINKWGDPGAWWDDRMNRTILPRIASRYGCGLVDIRSDWLRYLKTNHLEPSALLLDEVHLNAAGCDLMARLVVRYLVLPPDQSARLAADPVSTRTVGRDVSFREGRLVLPLDGNRVDLVVRHDAPDEPARTLDVRIDGKKPSEFPELYAITRPEPRPWSPLALIRVDHDRPLIVEDWVLTIDTFTADPRAFTFHVVGSRTGPDGTGSSSKPFVSHSGRVHIDPGGWFGDKPVEPGYLIRWSVQPQFVDRYLPAPPGDPAVDRATTLFQGLAPGRHTLELMTTTAEGPPTLAAIRVYDPPYTPSDPLMVRSLLGLGFLLAAIVGWWIAGQWVVGGRRWARTSASMGSPPPCEGLVDVSG